MDLIEIPVIKVHQNIGDLYVGVIKAKDLYDIQTVDRIRLERLKVPKYAGYQRALIEDRVDSIRLFLGTPDSTFPNAIILSIDSEYIVNWDDIRDNYGISMLKIEKKEGVVTVIDGQHRTAALNVADEDFQVIVSIFVDLEMVECAMIFTKINSTQKPVNPSIAYQLFGYAEGRSPQKTAHEIAEKLNTTEGSPFYKRLRMLGTKDGWTEGVLSQSTFCKDLMNLYTKSPIKDEYRLLSNERLELYLGYPLREFFINGNDQKILEIIWKYFFNIATVWKDQWLNPKSILVKTTGYSAFMKVLKNWLLSEKKGEILENIGVRETFERVKKQYELPENKFIRENYPAGSQGEIILRNRLLEDLGLT